MTDILLTGGAGQVGRSVQTARLPSGWRVCAPARADLDLADPAAIARVVAARPWAAVINAAAYTAVDRAEQDTTSAWTINAVAPRLLAGATASAGIPLIQVSTDYVFAGDKPTPYHETDAVGPLNVYGASKLAGEIAIVAINPQNVILRTAWVVSSTGANFIKTMLRLGRERDHIRVVDDQHGAPTAADDVANALICAAQRLIDDPDAPTGVFHFASAGEATWYDLARFVFDTLDREGYRIPSLEAITTADYPTPARRPANSRLDTTRVRREFAVTPRDWRDAVAETMAQLLASSQDANQ